jgi:hypothetical protein
MVKGTSKCPMDAKNRLKVATDVQYTDAPFRSPANPLTIDASMKNKNC